MHQAGMTPATLATATPPAVASATGLGTGGGASVQTEVGFTGLVQLVAGLNAATGGSVVLKFAQTPPTLFVAGHDGFGAITVTGQGTTSVTISWSAKLAPGRHSLAFEWATSK